MSNKLIKQSQETKFYLINNTLTGFLGGTSRLYIQRYEYLEILKKDKSAAGKSKLKKACKLFAYSQSEDDPRDKNAIKIYEDITDYLKNQSLEYFASLNYPSGDLVSLLYDIYDEVYTSRKKRFDKEQQCLSALNRKQR